MTLSKVELDVHNVAAFLYLVAQVRYSFKNTLGSGYPRLLRLFHEFFAKIAVHTDTIYISSFQRYLFCVCI